MAGLAGVLGIPKIAPTPGITASITPAGVSPNRGIVGDMAEMAGRPRIPASAAPAITPAAAFADAASTLMGAMPKSKSVLGGPGISPIVPVQGLEATVAPSNSWGSALAPVVRPQAPGVDIDPIGALRSRQFSDGFNFPGF